MTASRFPFFTSSLDGELQETVFNTLIMGQAD